MRILILLTAAFLLTSLPALLLGCSHSEEREEENAVAQKRPSPRRLDPRLRAPRKARKVSAKKHHKKEGLSSSALRPEGNPQAEESQRAGAVEEIREDPSLNPFSRAAEEMEKDWALRFLQNTDVRKEIGSRLALHFKQATEETLEQCKTAALKEQVQDFSIAFDFRKVNAAAEAIVAAEAPQYQSLIPYPFFPHFYARWIEEKVSHNTLPATTTEANFEEGIRKALEHVKTEGLFEKLETLKSMMRSCYVMKFISTEEEEGMVQTLKLKLFQVYEDSMKEAVHKFFSLRKMYLVDQVASFRFDLEKFKQEFSEEERGKVDLAFFKKYLEAAQKLLEQRTDLEDKPFPLDEFRKLVADISGET